MHSLRGNTPRMPGNRTSIRALACSFLLAAGLGSPASAPAQDDCCLVLNASDTNTAVMSTGGYLSLQSRTRPVQFAPVPGTYSVSFDFGFATEELPIDGEILDSIILVMENTNSGLSVVLFLADANSYGWLPFAPELFPNFDASVVLAPIVSPDDASLPPNQLAFRATFAVPHALATGWTDLTLMLYDYPNGLNSVAWMGPVTAIAPPGILDVASSGLFRSFGAHRGIFAPVTRDYALTNGGGSLLSWRASPAANWLTVTPSRGSLDWGHNTNVTLTVNNRARVLPPGFYTNEVSFLNDSLATNIVAREVVLVVIAPPLLQANVAAPGTVHIHLVAMPFADYRLEATADFISWTPIYTNSTGADGSYSFIGPAMESRRFFRSSFVYP